MEWQPIETAPKDGSQMLFFGRWNAQSLAGSEGHPHFAIGSWSTFSASAMLLEGFRDFARDTGISSSIHIIVDIMLARVSTGGFQPFHEVGNIKGVEFVGSSGYPPTFENPVPDSSDAGVILDGLPVRVVTIAPDQFCRLAGDV